MYFQEKLPLSKIPDVMKDGRCVMLYKNSVYYCCSWSKKFNDWCFGGKLFLGCTHFVYPVGVTENNGSGI